MDGRSATNSRAAETGTKAEMSSQKTNSPSCLDHGSETSGIFSRAATSFQNHAGRESQCLALNRKDTRCLPRRPPSGETKEVVRFQFATFVGSPFNRLGYRETSLCLPRDYVRNDARLRRAIRRDHRREERAIGPILRRRAATKQLTRVECTGQMYE